MRGTQTEPGPVSRSDPRWVDETLALINAGDTQALNDFVTVVRDELGALASRQRRKWTPCATIPTAALVHEAYLRLRGGTMPEFKSRGHFFAVMAKTMRRIIIDRYRRSRTLGITGLDNLDEVVSPEGMDRIDLLALNSALQQLKRVNAQWSTLVELKFFLGLEVKAIADVFGFSEKTVHNRWLDAKSWLLREIEGGSRGRDTSGNGH